MASQPAAAAGKASGQLQPWQLAAAWCPNFRLGNPRSERTVDPLFWRVGIHLDGKGSELTRTYILAQAGPVQLPLFL